MQRETDEQIAVPVVEDLAKRFPNINSVSLDMSYHSPANQQRFAELADFPVLPKKGKRSLTRAGTPTNLR
jgi:transposase, IS5 family